MSRARLALDASFWAFVDRESSPTGCWLWRGSTDGVAYGKVRWNGRSVLVHRLVYRMVIGPIPPGFDIDHLCRTPLCVRPEHLEPVPPRENQRRKREKASAKAIQQRAARLRPRSTEIASSRAE